MVKYLYVNQLQSICQFFGDTDVSRAGFRTPWWVVMGKNDRRRIVKQSRLDDFPWIDACRVDCAPKQLITTNDAVLVIQKQRQKYLILILNELEF